MGTRPRRNAFGPQRKPCGLPIEKERIFPSAGSAAEVFRPETLNAVYRMDVADWMRTMLSQWEK